MTATLRPDVPAPAAPYLAAVRSLLAHVPSDEREELLDDLVAHLAELAAEPGPSLRERLGTPSSYAEEFVGSLGIAPQATTRREQARERWFRAEHAESLKEIARDALPGWWVLRPLLAVEGLLAVVGSGRLADELGWQLLALPVAAALVPASVRAGRQGRRGRDLLATAAGLIGALAIAVAILSLPRYSFVYSGPDTASPGVLVHGDGNPISNIYAYDTGGELVEVFLVDQDGRPLDAADYDNQGEVISSYATDANGAPVLHRYPRQQERPVWDGRGERRQPVPPPAVVVPRMATTTTTTAPTTTTTTGATTTPP